MQIPVDESQIDVFLRDAAEGTLAPAGVVFEAHRPRLKRAVALRLDPRLAARLDASDIVQEAFADAAVKFADYARERPLPVYPWLFRLAMERLAQAHRTHVASQKRSVLREVPNWLPGRDGSSVTLLAHLVDRNPTPATHRNREETRERLRIVLDSLPELDHEILIMRYLESCSFPEIAVTLGIGESAAKMRHLRALQRIREFV